MLNDIFGRWVNLKPSCSIDLVFTIKQMGVVKISQELEMLPPVTMNVLIVVLNCQKCDQCLKGHKYLGVGLCHCLFLVMSQVSQSALW